MGRTILMLICAASFIFAALPDNMNAGECRNPLISGPSIWPPYIVKTGENKREGLAFDFADSLLTPLFGKPRIDPIKPWARVIKETKNGSIDIIIVMFKTQEREAYFKFSKPWTQNLYGIVTRPETQIQWENVNSLNDYQGGYLNGITLPEPYKTYADSSKTIQPIPTVPSLYKMLKAKRVDYLAVSIDSFRAIIPPDCNLQFKVLKDSIIKVPVYMGISMQSPCAGFMDDINKGIKSLKKPQ